MQRRSFLQTSLGVAALWPARMLLADQSGFEMIAARSLSGDEISLRSTDVKDLAARMRGQVLTAGQDEYEGVSEGEDAKVAANFGVDYLRLQRIKRKYDPTNQFRLSANVLTA